MARSQKETLSPNSTLVPFNSTYPYFGTHYILKMHIGLIPALNPNED